ncbi:MAG TPA: hypothetical protein VGX23_29885 [Actinocrinis sp.]|nr:hypothetical protein [Actinocrinis sp.]
MEIKSLYDIILRSMNENPLTHNPMKHDGTVGRRKPLLVTGAIVLAVIAIAAIAYSVYAWQQNDKLSDDITAKNAQIATLQKQKAAQTTSSPAPTPVPTPSPTTGSFKLSELGIQIVNVPVLQRHFELILLV